MSGNFDEAGGFSPGGGNAQAVLLRYSHECRQLGYVLDDLSDRLARIRAGKTSRSPKEELDTVEQLLRRLVRVTANLVHRTNTDLAVTGLPDGARQVVLLQIQDLLGALRSVVLMVANWKQQVMAALSAAGEPKPAPLNQIPEELSALFDSWLSRN